MSKYIQLLVYFTLAAILIIDGIRTLFHQENIFYKHGAARAVSTGLLLIGSGGTVAAFGLLTVLKEERIRPALWTFLVFSGLMMVIFVIQGQNGR